MPFGIIDPPGDEPLAGTEFLIRGQGPDSAAEVDTSRLKRVVHRLWPRWKKETAFAALLFSNIIFAALPGPIIAPATFALAGILKVPITKVAELSGYQLLIVGAIGPLVSVLAQKYGKRPQFLFAALTGTLGTIICVAGSQRSDYDALLAGRIVQGLGTTAWESLSLAAMGDIFYLHERGLRTALTVATLTCTPSMVSIVAGVMTETRGWTSVFVAALPFDVAALLATVFLLPETQFRRQPPQVPDAAGGAGVPTAAAAEDEEEKKFDSSAIETFAIASNPPHKTTYWQALRPWSGTTYTDRAMPRLLAEIVVHLANPAVVWIQLVSAVLISLYVVTAYITSQIWTPPPYGLDVAQNGYFYTGGFIGGVLATVGGSLCDWTARVLSRLNRGVFEAEFRIPVNILGLVFCSLAWFLFMWDVDNPRPDGYYLGAFCYGVACFGISIPSTAAGLYILDAFPSQATEVFILQMMIKNFIFYAFSTFINDWAAEAGPGYVFRTWGIVSIALLATCVPMYVFGKVNRRFMSNLYARHKIFRALG